MAEGLPELGVSSFSFGETSIELHHIKKPHSSKHSTQKRQCDLWEYVWGSSYFLASLLLKVGQELDGKYILEVGAGTGLSGIAAAKCGASVLSTDVVQDAIDLCAINALANGVGELVTTKRLSWHKEECFPQSKFDIIIGADVLFMRGCVKPVANVIHRSLKAGGVAVITDPGRPSADDLETDDRLVVTRVDLFNFSTPTVVMKKVSVLLITLPGEENSCGQVDSFVSILKTFQEESDQTIPNSREGVNVFGYVLQQE
jgi:predicted nicotinamide N-methyase